MSTNGPKRIAVRICTPDVIELFELLPRGFKSLVVESALTAYIKSDTGQLLINQLIQRKNHPQRVKNSSASARITHLPRQ